MKQVRLAARLTEALAHLIPAGSSILVGLSGGIDSVVLLHLLHRIAPGFSWQLKALHVHHGISPNADDWADFCSKLCASLNVLLHIERVDIKPLLALGVEAAARQRRYEAFASQVCDFTALAHHADDQVETLFLQLLRGAGVSGASAMPIFKQRTLTINAPIGEHREMVLIRPLLRFTRREILDYAATCKLTWIEDESNADCQYPRNFLRHQLLPLMEEKFPAYRETLTRSTQHFAEAAELLDDLARLDAGLGDGQPGLEIKRLQALSWPRAKNLLRHFLSQQHVPMPQLSQLDDMLRQLCSARIDASICACFGGGEWQLHRFRGHVYVQRKLAEFDPHLVVTWQGETALDWPALNSRIIFQTGVFPGISIKKLQGRTLTLRLRKGGESLRPQVNASTRTLKNLLQEYDIPPWLRDRVPLLYCDKELICVPGVAISSDYQSKEGETGVFLTLCPN